MFKLIWGRLCKLVSQNHFRGVKLNGGIGINTGICGEYEAHFDVVHGKERNPAGSFRGWMQWSCIEQNVKRIMGCSHKGCNAHWTCIRSRSVRSHWDTHWFNPPALSLCIFGLKSPHFLEYFQLADKGGSLQLRLYCTTLLGYSLIESNPLRWKRCSDQAHCEYAYCLICLATWYSA